MPAMAHRSGKMFLLEKGDMGAIAVHYRDNGCI